MASTADIKNGVVINLDNNLQTIVEFQHVKPGKGGAFVRTKLKNILTGKVIERTFRSGEKLDIIRVEDKHMQYLYKEDDSYIFMDQETFDQVNVSVSVVGDTAKFLKESEIVSISFHGERPLVVTLPNFIIFNIVECDPGVRGDTVSNVTKPAKLETGAIVQVPLFVEQEDKIRVDTRTGQYLERAKE